MQHLQQPSPLPISTNTNTIISLNPSGEIDCLYLENSASAVCPCSAAHDWLRFVLTEGQRDIPWFGSRLSRRAELNLQLCLSSNRWGYLTVVWEN